MESEDRLRQQAEVFSKTTTNRPLVYVSEDLINPALECVVSAGAFSRHLQVGEYLLWMS